MPRQKTELTKSGKAIGVRLTQSEYEQWVKLGGGKWLRKLLQEKKMPAFNTWSQENLAKFAAEAYVKMQEQQNHIEQLQNDLKDAIKAYRELIK
jgi:hypothetical protein